MKQLYFIIFGMVLALSFACSNKKHVPAYANFLETQFQNKLYRNFDSVTFDTVLKSYLYNRYSADNDFESLLAFHQQNDFQPELFLRFLSQKQIDVYLDSLVLSERHGFDKEIFHFSSLRRKIDSIRANKIKDMNTLYSLIAEAELSLSSSWVKYVSFMTYGCSKPQDVMDRFRILVKRADSATKLAILNTHYPEQMLRQVYPKHPDYAILQAEYLKQKEAGRRDVVKVLLVNMERCRWQIPALKSERVEVNIPTFGLRWLGKDSVRAQMRVCVGETIEENYAEKMKEYLKTKDINQKPSNHQTSILISSIRAVQVNPIWNIPSSIAKREIYNRASRDRFYLANSRIKVYKNGRLITNPDTIQWHKYSQDRLPFMFKQDPGVGNALGKFKFIFANNDGLYLHDTNAKSAFGKSNRAVSHGCVRIQDPLKFAELLTDDPQLYDKIRMSIDLKPLDSTGYAAKLYEKKKLEARKDSVVRKFVFKPTTYIVKNPIQLYIKYQTAYIGNRNEVLYAPDVYQLDQRVWNVLKKYTR